MDQLKYSKFVDAYWDKYTNLGYDLFDVNTEEGMIDSTPVDLFEGGEEEKEAALCALHYLWCKLMDEKESVQ
jgi:hypothetical protein